MWTFYRCLPINGMDWLMDIDQPKLLLAFKSYLNMDKRLLHQAEQSLLPTATRKNSKQKDNNKKFPQSFVSCTHNFAWPICPPLLVIVVWLTRRHLEGGHSLFFRVDLFCAFPCVPVLRALHSISALPCCALQCACPWTARPCSVRPWTVRP